MHFFNKIFIMDLIKNEQKLIDLLLNLKENHNILGVKAEFEDEGASFDEASRLKKIADVVGLNFTLKIGGCGALNDINQAKSLDVNTIVAPMIESSYALKKFIQAVESVYSEEKPKLLINIETISGYNNFDEIMAINEAKQIDGIVVGRFDMSKSLGGGCKECDSKELFGIVNNLSKKTEQFSKLFLVGGGIKEKSLSFLDKISCLNSFETRKIIFDAQNTLKAKDSSGIVKAIEFEIAWLECKKQLNDKEIKRIVALKNRCKSLCIGVK